jgi:hypothetical protein
MKIMCSSKPNIKEHFHPGKALSDIVFDAAVADM